MAEVLTPLNWRKPPPVAERKWQERWPNESVAEWEARLKIGPWHR